MTNIASDPYIKKLLHIRENNLKNFLNPFDAEKQQKTLPFIVLD